MEMVEINIGEEINKRRKELGITIRDFAAMIHTSSGNVCNILKRRSLDGEKLMLISKVLDFNFFSLYVLAEDVILAKEREEEYEIFIRVKVKKSDILNGNVCKGCRYFKNKEIND